MNEEEIKRALIVIEEYRMKGVIESDLHTAVGVLEKIARAYLQASEELPEEMDENISEGLIATAKLYNSVLRACTFSYMKMKEKMQAEIERLKKRR